MRALRALVCTAAILCGTTAAAQGQGVLSGVVVDSLGGRVAGATVTLNGDGDKASETKSDAEGAFTFRNLAPGRYQVTATAQGFQPRTSEPVYAGPGTRTSVEVVLEVGPLQQDIVVTAEAGGVLQSQTGAPVTVIDSATIEALNKPDVLESLRLVPGAPDRAGRSARRCDLTLPARRQLQLHQGPRRRHARERHWRWLRLLATRHRGRRSHRGAAPDQQRGLRQRRADRRGEHHHAARVVPGAGIPVLDRRRQPGHVQELALARRRGTAVRLLLAVPRTSRPTTTRRTADTTAAPTPAASAWRLAAAPT